MTDTQPEGWYPNPFDPSEELFWDGSKWSGESRPVGAPTAPLAQSTEQTLVPTAGMAVPPAAPNVAASDPPSPLRTGIVQRVGRAAFWALILGIIAIVLAVIPGASFVAWLAAIPAIVLGIIGLLGKIGSHRLALAGLIEGAAAILIGMVVSIVFIGSLAGTSTASEQTHHNLAPKSAPITAHTTTPQIAPTPTPSATRVRVPNVKGEHQDHAEQKLTDAQLVFSESGDTYGDGHVTSQTPKAGTKVLPGTSIKLHLGEPRIVYKISGNGSSALVTWTAADGSIEQASGAHIPWSKSVGEDGDFYTISAQDDNGTTISCSIYDDGVRVDHHTATGMYAIVECEDS